MGGKTETEPGFLLLEDSVRPARYIAGGDGPSRSLFRGQIALRDELAGMVREGASVEDLARQQNPEADRYRAMEEATLIPASIWQCAESGPETSLMNLLESVPVSGELHEEGIHPVMRVMLIKSLKLLNENMDLMGPSDEHFVKYDKISECLKLATDLVETGENRKSTVEALQEVVNSLMGISEDFQHEERLGLEFFFRAMDEIVEAQSSEAICSLQAAVFAAAPVKDEDSYRDIIGATFDEAVRVWGENVEVLSL